MIVDSHCHLNMLELKDFNGSMDTVLANCKAAGVQHCLTVCTDLREVDDLVAIASKHKGVSISIGVHPTDKVPHEPSCADLVQETLKPFVVAVGETGLDYYRSEPGEDMTWQQNRFRAHIQAARQTKLPLIIHTRCANEDTIALMKQEHADECRGVMHCFTEEWSVAQKALDLGFYISISGIVTFKNAQQVQEVASKVPLDRLLIETDSPYLAPIPFRGKQNQPSYVKHVADFVAQLRGISVDELAQATTHNFFELFYKAKAHRQ